MTNQSPRTSIAWKCSRTGQAPRGSSSVASPLRDTPAKRCARFFLVTFASIIIAILMQTHSLGAGGDLLWQAEVDKTSLNSIVSRGNRVFIAGGSSSGEWIVRTYNFRNGNPIWEDTFSLKDVQLVASGIAARRRRVYVVGSGSTLLDSGNFWLVRAYDSKTGAVLWEDRFSGDNGAFANAVAVEGRRVFVVGAIARRDAPNDFDWMVRTYDAKDGSLLWEDRFELADQFQMATAVAVRGRRVSVAGGGLAAQEFNGDWLVRTYRASDGTLLWQDSFDPGGDFGQAVAIAAESRQVFAAGRALPNSEEGNWVVRSHDSKTGELLWQDSFDVGLTGLAARAVAEKGKQLSVAGGAEIGGEDKWIVKTYDRKDGSVIWVDEFAKAYGASARTIASKGSRVFAAGCQGSADFTTCGNGLVRSYHAQTGTVLWEDVFNLDSEVNQPNLMTARRNRVIIAGFLADINKGFVRAYEAR